MTDLLSEQIDLKQQDSHTYTAGYHDDWLVGPVYLGSIVAAIIHSAAVKHITTTLAEYKQPDIHTLHVEYLRPCGLETSTIKVSDLKLGRLASFMQLTLSQDGEDKAVAFATSTNFDVTIGPTIKTAYEIHPRPPPIPDFAKVEAEQKEDNWLPARFKSDIAAHQQRLLWLNPRRGFGPDGVIDLWSHFDEPERFSPTHLVYYCDLMPSPTDTWLRNGGIVDANNNHKMMVKWDEEHPGQPVVIESTIEQALQKSYIETTLTLNVEFKRRLPKDGLRWVYSRFVTKMIEDGRIDVDLTVCDEKMLPICFARQTQFAYDFKKRFGTKTKL